jgi:hypothetical protein
MSYPSATRNGCPPLQVNCATAGLFQLNLDSFWLKDESLEDSANLPDPDVIAQEIVEDLEAALTQFAAIASDLKR